MKNYNNKYKLGILISIIGSISMLILSTEKDYEFSISRTIYACFFMGVLFYLIYIYKDKYKS